MLNITSTQPARVTIQFDPDTSTGFNWPAASSNDSVYVYEAHGRRPYLDSLVRDAVQYFSEAVERMTGTSTEVVTATDVASATGIVLCRLDRLSPAEPAFGDISDALKEDPSDPHGHVEAFSITTSPDRVLIVTHDERGLCNAIVELLESVNYVALGMGPNWTHVPDHQTTPLELSLDTAGRPGFHRRIFGATSGQERGVGTVRKLPASVPAPEAPDELVGESWKRWVIGARMHTYSTPTYPGHTAYAWSFVRQLAPTLGRASGLLASNLIVGTRTDRSTPPTDLLQVFVEIDGPDRRYYVSREQGSAHKWVEVEPYEALHVTLDFSSPAAREYLLSRGKKLVRDGRADGSPLIVFPADPEDGAPDRHTHFHENPQWYPDYLREEAVEFGRPYALSGFVDGLAAVETWDPESPSDQLFGFTNWLLRELDKWIDFDPEWSSLSPAERIDLQSSIRTSVLSYGYHDVPPNFNIDQRNRVAVASYPNNRGKGKWRDVRSQLDIHRAFGVLNPFEGTQEYWIYSSPDIAVTKAGLIPMRELSPAKIGADITQLHQANVRAITAESDFNFGSLGLGYYLHLRMLWNPLTTPSELADERRRWMQLAFGAAWCEMESYYDLLLKNSYFYNGPATWNRAVRLLDAAYVIADGVSDHGAIARINDLKIYWYYYHLLHTGMADKSHKQMREYIWKAQMSYVQAMHPFVRKIMGYGHGTPELDQWVATMLDEVPGDASFFNDPPRYTDEEINGDHGWWPKVAAGWEPPSSVSHMDSSIDTNDLVAVREAFDSQLTTLVAAFHYNVAPGRFFEYAANPGDTLSFVAFAIARDESQVEPKLQWQASRYDALTRSFEPIVMTGAEAPVSAMGTHARSGATVYGSVVTLQAPQAGTYLFSVGAVGRKGVSTNVAASGYDPEVAMFGTDGPNPHGMSFLDRMHREPSDTSWLYIPKSTRSLDFEFWAEQELGTSPQSFLEHTLTIFEDFDARNSLREFSITRDDIYQFPLSEEETGSLLRISANRRAVPYFHSIPNTFATHPSQLLIPRSVAIADGLEIL